MDILSKIIYSFGFYTSQKSINETQNTKHVSKKIN